MKYQILEMENGNFKIRHRLTDDKEWRQTRSTYTTEDEARAVINRWINAEKPYTIKRIIEV